MSRREIPIRFTTQQKERVKTFLGKVWNEVVIPSRMGTVMRYGIVPKGGLKANIIVLTAEQKRLLQKEFNVNCDYIELTNEMKFR